MSRAIGMGPALAAALLAWTGAAAAESGQSCQPDLDKLAGWSGIWVAEGMQADLNGRELPGQAPYVLRAKLIGLGAPWNENGWARFEAGPGPPTGAGPQRQFGFPAMMSSPAPFTIVVAREQTVMVSEYRDVRYIFTDGRGHIPEEERWPTLWGDSTGCWEGETLVIDTVSAKYSPEVSMIAPPFSDNARFTERMRLVAPGRIESEITVEDPETLERAWTVHMAYERVPSLDRLVHEGDALDNNRIVVGPNGLTIAPTAEAADPPERVTRQAARLSPGEMDRVVGVYRMQAGPPLQFTFERRGARMFYRVDPVQPFLLPIHPSGDLDYFSRMHDGVFRFTVGSDGEVTGVTGTSPEGEPFAATRSGA